MSFDDELENGYRVGWLHSDVYNVYDPRQCSGVEKNIRDLKRAHIGEYQKTKPLVLHIAFFKKKVVVCLSQDGWYTRPIVYTATGDTRREALQI